MNKFLSYLLLIILTFFVFVPAAFAADTEFNFDLTANGEIHTTVEPGGKVEVKLFIIRNDGQDYELWGAQDYVLFDTDFLTLDEDSIQTMTAVIDGRETDIFAASGITFGTGINDRIYTNHPSTKGLAVRSTITVVTFNLIAGMREGTTKITHDTPEMKSSTRDFLSLTTNDAIVTIAKTSADYKIVSSAGTGGSITPSGNVTVEKGKSQTFTITANSGYNISSVTVDGISQGVIESYTFKNVAANHTITASFQRTGGGGGGGGGGSTVTTKTYKIETVESEYGETKTDVSVSESNKTITITLVPSAEYELLSVKVTDKTGNIITTEKKTDSTFIFTMPAADVTVEATYKAIVSKPTKPAKPDETGVSTLLQTKDHIKYINGYDDITVRPEANMTRAETAQMFYNLLLDKSNTHDSGFDDVAPDAWYYTAVNKLTSNGVIMGYDTETFGPEDFITREQFCAIATRFTNVTDAKATRSFSDVTEDMWSHDNVITAASLGWINGFEDNTFRPQNNITRAEVVTIVNHMLGRSADKTYVDLNSGIVKFTDLKNNSDWYYYDVVEASIAHDYAISDDAETWKNIK